MKFLLSIVLLGLAASAGAAVSTNDVPPAVQLDFIQLESVKVESLVAADLERIDTGAIAREFRQDARFAAELRKLSKHVGNGHSWLCVRVKEIEAVAATDRATARRMIKATMKKLRGWGAEL